jgi:hypothetical protein
MKHTLLPIVLASVLLVMPGCGSQGEGFNNTLADLQTRLDGTEKKLEDLIAHALNHDELEAKRKAAFDDFSTAVTESRTKFDALTVPPGDNGKRFHKGFADYLKVQEEAVPLYKQLLVAAVKKDLDAMNRTGEKLQDMRQKRSALAGQLPHLQKEYAKEAGLKLVKK